MADNKKYYYMRLKENFFDSSELVAMESLPDGVKYSNILLKMYLRSLRDEGRLMIGTIPYSPEMIASITKQDVDTVNKALKLFQAFGLIEILDSGAIYMLDIQNYIGKSSTEADRQREYQTRISEEKDKRPNKSCKKSNKKSNKKSTPEIELETELEPKSNPVYEGRRDCADAHSVPRTDLPSVALTPEQEAENERLRKEAMDKLRGWQG